MGPIQSLLWEAQKTFYPHRYNTLGMFYPLQSDTDGNLSAFVVWHLKNTPILSEKTAHSCCCFCGHGPFWKQACYFISLLLTWAQLISLITSNKLKGGHCWYGYCCDKLTSKRQTHVQGLFFLKSPHRPPRVPPGGWGKCRSLLLVAKHNHS